jgi:NAD-dependent SIR2 family protein deacetylase
MVTNYPQQLTAAAEFTRKATTDAGLMARMATRIGQVVCGLHGHDAVLHFEGRRVMMRCTSCLHDTPGWEISGQGPRIRYSGDARRHVLKPRLTLHNSAELKLVLRKSA